MTDRVRLEQALIAADRAGDVEAARKLASALRSMPAQPAAQPSGTEDVPPLPGTTEYDEFHRNLSSRPSRLHGMSDYLSRLGKAEKHLATTLLPGANGGGFAEPFLGTLEAAGALLSGGIAAPILGTAEAITLGTDPEQAFARYTYQPRLESGKAQVGLLGAALSPLTESGADIALGPLFAGESTAVRVPANAARPTLRRPVSSGAGAPVVESGAPAPALQGSSAAGRQAGLESVPRSTAPIEEIAPDLSVLERRPSTPPKSKPQKAPKRQEVDSPETLARYEQLQSLPVPVPATRGQLTRDPVQLRNESNVSATETGKPIRDVYVAQNEAILSNLEVLKGRVANRTAPAETPEQVGMSVQNPLREKLELAKQKVKDKYAAAEAAGEMQGKVSPVRIIKAIRSTPDATHFSWVESWLSKAKVVEKTDAGTVTRKLSLKELEDLRQAAVARAMDGGTEGYYAGKIIRAIDEATEGAGGRLYKDARAARRAQAMEFEETGAVARLVDNKSRTDRAVALEDTWRKTVVGGSIQDLRNVKRSLLTGGDAKTRTAGRRAWRDMKAQTIEHIRQEATKSVATNERGQSNVTPAAMKRAIDSIGKDKLNEIFGPGTAARLDRILEATRTVKTVPPAGHAGSSTMGNVLAFLERGLGKIPVVGSTAAGAVNVGIKLHQMGASRRVVREAQRMPRNAIAEPPKEPQRNALLEF